MMTMNEGILKKKVKKKIATISYLIIKPFIVPIIIVIIFILLVSSITDILYIAFDNDTKIDMEKELAYYDTNYNKERDKQEIKGFFSSVWEFINNMFGGLGFAEDTDWPVENHYSISSGFGYRDAPTARSNNNA